MKANRLTSEQIVRTYLERIETIDRAGFELKSVLAINPNALTEARTLDTERSKGKLRGFLHGIPILIKDNIESADAMPTTAGSLALRENDTRRDSPLVARLRAEGAIILGKTNLSEWSNMRSGDAVGGWSAIGGVTRNPYALDRTASGSSTGSGVTVYANLAAAAISTDTNGSITHPAAVNWIVALRPTLGLVSRHLVIPIGSSQDAPGPMTRTIADAALLLNVISGTNPNDAATREADSRLEDYLKNLKKDVLEKSSVRRDAFQYGELPAGSFGGV
jgi:amidase